MMETKTEFIIREIASKYFNPTTLVIDNIELENHNIDYYGASFTINNHTVRFRKAKVTPNKIGQFVVAWEKDDKKQNKAYNYQFSPDFLFIYTEMGNNKGAFVFPKDVLLENKILSSASQKGKMGFRVYPQWDKVDSPQAMKTKEWQSSYFIDLSKESIHERLNLLLKK